MVRGANLELLDITYDGSEDHLTGYLRGGLGQLVDGKYGLDNFKATGKNGVVKGERKSCGKNNILLLYRLLENPQSRISFQTV